MSNHVTSLELSKQLKEVGWKKETEFWYLPCFNGELEEWHLVPKKEICGCGGCKRAVPAPISDELLEELPKFVAITKLNDNSYSVILLGTDIDFRSNLPNALAKMWLYLKKEGLIK